MNVLVSVAVLDAEFSEMCPRPLSVVLSEDGSEIRTSVQNCGFGVRLQTLSMRDCWEDGEMRIRKRRQRRV